MNFTREPIIETIITAKDGYKVLVRSSKSSSNEEYTVDAVEVVSFGNSLFFRCLERPKCFLLPVSDYEVIEVKETRVVLKNAPLERTIKIGGGRENPKIVREPYVEKPIDDLVEEEGSAKEETTVVSENVIDPRKRDRKRHRRRRGGGGGSMDERGESRGQDNNREPGNRPQGNEPKEGQPIAPPVFTTLFPPPPTLISETMSRYKDAPFIESNILARQAAAAESERPTIETFVEDRKEKDIVHQELMESEVVPMTSLPEEMNETQEFFVAEERQEEEDDSQPKSHLHHRHEGFDQEST